MISIRRVYERSASDEGVRFLVERLWPRGVKKESLHIAALLVFLVNTLQAARSPSGSAGFKPKGPEGTRHHRPAGGT